MTDREKLVELIQSAVGGCSTYWAGLIADELISNGVTVLTEPKCNKINVKLPKEIVVQSYSDKWIPVTERLPESRDDVLVCRTWWNETRNPQIGWYNDVSQQWQILESDGYYPCKRVTHWMPLPQPPKGE